MMLPSGAKRGGLRREKTDGALPAPTSLPPLPREDASDAEGAAEKADAAEGCSAEAPPPNPPAPADGGEEGLNAPPLPRRRGELPATAGPLRLLLPPSPAPPLRPPNALCGEGVEEAEGWRLGEMGDPCPS